MAQGQPNRRRGGSEAQNRIANAIPYVRIARRRLVGYTRGGAMIHPLDLERVSHLLSLALNELGSTVEDENGSDAF